MTKRYTNGTLIEAVQLPEATISKVYIVFEKTSSHGFFRRVFLSLEKAKEWVDNTIYPNSYYIIIEEVTE